MMPQFNNGKAEDVKMYLSVGLANTSWISTGDEVMPENRPDQCPAPPCLATPWHMENSPAAIKGCTRPYCGAFRFQIPSQSHRGIGPGVSRPAG